MNIIGQKVVKTRKPHNCWGCTKELPIGDKVEVVTSVDGGNIMTVYWCDKCQDYLDTLDNYFCIPRISITFQGVGKENVTIIITEMEE